jgi:hypothetical protein
MPSLVLMGYVRLKHEKFTNDNVCKVMTIVHRKESRYKHGHYNSRMDVIGKRFPGSCGRPSNIKLFINTLKTI